MLRSLRPKLAALMKNKIIQKFLPTSDISTISAVEDHYAEIDVQALQYQDFLQNEENDGWEVRRCFNEMLGVDAVPHPIAIIAGVKACRRLNDIALAIRFLEGCRYKCGAKQCEIYPYLVQEIQPTLTELGLPTIEEIGYDAPELALKPAHWVKVTKDGCPCDC